MRISVQKENLLRGIQAVQNAVSTRGSLPILANILLEAKEEQLTLTATDLDIAISCIIPATVAEKDSITVPAKRFGDIIKELWSDDEIRIQTKKARVVQIETKKTCFKLPGLPKDDFPQIPGFSRDKNAVTLPQEMLGQMLRMTQFAMSRDEARYVLNGTLFTFNKKTIRLVATDGRRLAMIEKEMEKALPIDQSVIVPTKTIQELSRNLTTEGEVSIFFKENQLQFKINNILITSRLIEGEFPNYEQVIPQKTKEQILVKTKDFLSATKRANIFTNQDSQSIRINLDTNRMIITKNTPDVGEAYEEIETDYKGGDFTIGFNPTYLIDVLKNIEEEKIRFELIDPEKPGVIRTGDNYTYIILPMQLTP